MRSGMHRDELRSRRRVCEQWALRPQGVSNELELSGGLPLRCCRRNRGGHPRLPAGALHGGLHLRERLQLLRCRKCSEGRAWLRGDPMLPTGGLGLSHEFGLRAEFAAWQWLCREAVHDEQRLRVRNLYWGHVRQSSVDVRATSARVEERSRAVESAGCCGNFGGKSRNVCVPSRPADAPGILRPADACYLPNADGTF